MAEHESAGVHRPAQNDVHRASGDRHQKALPARMTHKLARIAGARLHGIFAGHLHVAAQRQKADAVVGIATAEADKALAKAEAEDFNPDLEQLGYSIVTELMDKHQNAQNKDKGCDIKR